MKVSYNDLTYTELVNKKEELHKEYLKLRMDKVLGHLEFPCSRGVSGALYLQSATARVMPN